MIVKNQLAACLILFVLILMYSCNNNARFEAIPVEEVQRNDFIDKITVSGEMESSQPQSINCPMVRAQVTIKYLVEDGRFVNKGDTLVILESSDLENDYIESLKNLEKSISNYHKTKADLELQILMLKTQVETIETDARIKQLDSVQLKFASPVRKQILELELEMSSIKKEQIVKELEFRESIKKSELQKMQLRIKQQENRLSRTKETLDKLVIISNASGYAVRAMSYRTGDKVKEGEMIYQRYPILQIPNLEKMQVKLSLSEANFKRVKNGQKVNINIDAMPGITMKGKVKYKEPVGKPINRNSKVKVFTTVVSVDSLAGKIMPGITAKCDIILEQIDDTLVIPYVSVFDDDSAKYVFVKQNKSFEKRKVELVTNNNNLGVIKSGVVENEMIALIRPPESLQKIKKLNEKNNITVADSTFVMLQK